MWFNPIMEGLLKSPFHSLISNNTMIIYYSGCKSGKAYHTPVGYQRIDNTLFTTSSADRIWWRNFRKAADVKVLLKGKIVDATVQAFDDEATVAEGLKQFIGSNRRSASMFKIDMHDDGQLDPESLQKAARARVLIRTTLK